ncbi:MAG: right-handed parallel beta-helix repeat-containing protein [Candidatus Hodarchaeota archaeon]
MYRRKVALVVLLFFITASLEFSVTTIRISTRILQNVYPNSSIQYENHNPIYIYSNEDFQYLAAEENWIGNGTQFIPYLISGYEISGSFSLIEIQNTDVYFQIRNCFKIGGERGIYISDVENGKVLNNKFEDIYSSAIEIDYSKNIIISNNIAIDARS